MMAVRVESFDLLSESLAERHWEQLAALRECPVGKSELYGGVWLLSKYDDVVSAARNWQAFSSAEGSAPVPLGTDGKIKLMPISTDPPFQSELRRLIDPYFSARRVTNAEGVIRRGSVQLFEKFQHRGYCDFTADYAIEFPANTFFQYSFGVEPDATGRVMGWLDHILKTPNEAQESVKAFYEWTANLIEGRRNSAPRDDVLDGLLTGTVGDRKLSDSERMMVIMNLIIGGVETTTHALGNVVYILATRPDIRARLNEQRHLIPAAVEEFLRYEAPADARGRVTTCPMHVGGADIPARERVALFYSAANRDPAKFPSPDEIIVDRFVGRSDAHLGFGAGAHRCPGAHLARTEIKVTIEEVLDRMPDLEMAAGEIKYHHGLTRGPIAVPIRFRPYQKMA